MKRLFSLLLLSVIALCPPNPVLSQSQGSINPDLESCQSLLNVVSGQCAPLGNCTGLRCTNIRDNTMDLNGSRNATFVVTKCEDPVKVDLTVESSATVDRSRFSQSSIAVFEGAGSVSVTMERNASYLGFQATLMSDGTVLIPQVLVPLNASECMCDSLADLAEQATHSLVEPECSTNELCNGVRCELDIFGSIYYLEIIIDSCESAVEVLVEDSQGQVLHSSTFNQTETKTLQIGSLSLPTEVVIVKHNYSMELQSFVTVPFFGREEIIPRHTIILDKTNCTNSSTPITIATVAPPTTPHPPTPPPLSASEICHAFYSIVNRTRTDSFTCVQLTPCTTGITCQLNILDTHYNIDIGVTVSNEVGLDVMDGRDSTQLSYTLAQNATVPLPKPFGGSLTFYQRPFLIGSDTAAQTSGVNFLLILSVPDLASSNSVDFLNTTLIPYSTIPFVESCAVLRQYAQRYSQCSSIGGCSAAQCEIPDTLVTFVVTKCVDPVVVDVTVRSRSTGRVSVRRSFNHSDNILIGGTSLNVVMGRNATDLQFEATLRQAGLTTNTTAVPKVTLPLNASECMCSSLEDLASRAGGTVIEPECNTNPDCNGIVCEIDIFGNVFYLESIILPCLYAVDVVIRNDQRQPTFMTVYNRTAVHVIDLGIFSTNLYVEIVRHPYSMEVSAVVDTILFGNLTLVPHHTIILDKTSCDLPHIVTIPPPATLPPPTSPPPSAPEICHAFYNIIQSTSEGLVCKQMADCETGIQCMLEILNTFYSINVTIVDKSKAIAFSVADSSQKMLGSVTSKNATISLPVPPGSTLIFNQSVSVDKQTIGFALAISTPNFGSSNVMVHQLIGYSEVPIKKSVSNSQSVNRTAIGVTIPILLLLVSAVVVLLTALGCMVYCKRRRTNLPFRFQYMKDSDDIVTEDISAQAQGSEMEENEDKKLDLSNGQQTEQELSHGKPSLSNKEQSLTVV